MKKIWKAIKNVGLYIWQLPQNIIGLFLRAYYRGMDIKIDDNALSRISTKMRGGISLGKYIIASHTRLNKHEFGHTRQSMMLGPLYLLIIGLPSIIHAMFHSGYCKNRDYYHFYTEKWANKLADKYWKA